VALLGVRTRRCLITDLIFDDYLGSQTLGTPYSVPYERRRLIPFSPVGLRAVELIIADEHKGLKAAAAKVLGATIQRCRVHFMRNALACVCKKDRPIVTAALQNSLRPGHAGKIQGSLGETD
jgi:hypothetical protein